MSVATPRIIDITPSSTEQPDAEFSFPALDAPAKPAVDAPPAEPAPTKLYVATPCYGCMMTDTFFLSLSQLQTECHKRGIECFVDFVGNESLVQRARNILAARFLNSSSTHLLFIDADIGFHPDTVFRLLEADKDIVSAIYPKKSWDWEAVRDKLAKGVTQEPVHMLGLDYNMNLAGPTARVENGFVQVLDAATGFMLVRRAALEAMAAKYADTLTCVNDLPGDRDSPGYIKEYVALFDCMIDPDTRRYLSEDYAMNRRAQAMGLETWADLASPLCHVGTHFYEGDLRQRFNLVYTG